MDACIGAVLWWAFGYAIAYGDDGANDNPIVGVRYFFLLGTKDFSPPFFANWMFQWAFAATAATIVSGAVAERC